MVSATEDGEGGLVKNYLEKKKNQDMEKNNLLSIRFAHHGFIVTSDNSEYVFRDTKEEVIDMLYFIVEEIGESGTKWDKERITISLQPGKEYYEH